MKASRMAVNAKRINDDVGIADKMIECIRKTPGYASAFEFGGLVDNLKTGRIQRYSARARHTCCRGL